MKATYQSLVLKTAVSAYLRSLSDWILGTRRDFSISLPRTGIDRILLNRQIGHGGQSGLICIRIKLGLRYIEWQW